MTSHSTFIKSRFRGFTLIELLIVIAIILILIAIALPNFLEAQIRARLTSARGCLHTYRTANEAYFSDFGIHAPDVDGGERESSTNFPWINLWQLNRGVSCGNLGELCTFIMLTTPIKYINDLCYDPFLEQRNDPNVGKSYSLPEYTTYLSGGRLRKEWGNTFGLRYMILSRGADLDSDANDYEEIWRHLGPHRHHGTLYPVIYSPTNGTKSDGDLVVTNRGHEGP